MVKILDHIPHVMVIQETSVQPGRDKLQGIFNYARLYGPWHLHLVHGRAGEQRPELFTDWAFYDGIIVGQMMFGLVDALQRARKPTILMDPLDDMMQRGSPFATFSCTLDDSDSVGKTGADYFIERGYRHFAYVGKFLNRNWSVRRGEHFAKRIREAGFDCHLYRVPETPCEGRVEEKIIIEWLCALPNPVALLAAMDSRAHQVIELCAESGLRVPQDLAVLGIDDDELLCNGSIPTLSSIRRDTELCGFQAANMLDRLMRRGTRKREVFLYGVREIVTRDSTRKHTVPIDPIVHKAREFIRINAGTGIGVPDIIKHLHVSRRLAETRFRRVCGHSLLDEIQNARLERVERLLKETNLPLSEVCIGGGYSTDVHLRRIFKRRFGCSMRDYRAQMLQEKKQVTLSP